MHSTLPTTCDTLIVGGGVVGLSIAYELSRRGVKAVVVDRQAPGREASWAGAGILPPGSWFNDHPALETLAAVSRRLDVGWSSELLAETDIDNHLRQVGGLHLAADADDLECIRRTFGRWAQLGIPTHEVSPEEIERFEPHLCVGEAGPTFHIPGEVQIDNRQHVDALVAACLGRQVMIVEPAEVTKLHLVGRRIGEVHTTGGSTSPGQVILAVGSWSGGLGELLGIRMIVRPIRGQMLEFRPHAERLLNGHVHCGDHYMVLRPNGRLIVGSTVEDVGFDKQPTPQRLAELEAFARRMLPSLESEPVTDAWAGLRPASGDGLPYIGAVPDVENAYVATGHFRAGLQFASGTAVALADLMADQRPFVDLEPFRIDR